MKVLRAFCMCLGMFTALPLPYRPWDEDARGLMTACLPPVGAIVGAIWYAAAILAQFLPETLRAAAIAAMPFLLTGFMHLDGFMDTADAILSWRPLEERRKILKDVHCGSFAVVAVVLLMLGMFASAKDIPADRLRALVLIPAASRCLSAFCVSALKPIGHSEYARMNLAGTPLTAVVLLGLTLLTAALWTGLVGLLAVAATALGYAAAMLCAFRALQGVSGDLAGYALCVGELCGLAALAIL